jgi:hypothetical protein
MYYQYNDHCNVDFKYNKASSRSRVFENKKSRDALPAGQPTLDIVKIRTARLHSKGVLNTSKGRVKYMW